MQLPRYDSYKDSGVEWLGDIPDHWKCDSIRSATILKSDKNRPDLQVLSVYREYGVILKDSRDDNHNATSLDTSTYKVVKPGDLVVNKMKAWQGSMGVSEYEGIVSPAYITCKTNQNDFNPKYLHYLLRSKNYIDVYNSISYGVRIGQWDLRYEDFKKVVIPIPLMEEQQRIVSFLDQKTAEIDEAIAQKQKLIELLQEQKSILINQAVTKGLNPDAPMKDSSVEWIGEIPAHWDVKKIGYLAKLIQTGPFGSQLHQDEYITDGIPIINPSHMADGLVAEDKRFSVSTKTADRLFRHKFKAGDIAIARRGEMGRCALITEKNAGWLCGTGSMLFRPKKESIDPSFFSITFRSHCVVKQLSFSSVGATMDNLNTDLISKIIIPVPDYTEQVDIVKYCKLAASASLKSQHIVEKEIATIQEFKQSLISSAVTGKIKI